MRCVCIQYVRITYHYVHACPKRFDRYNEHDIRFITVCAVYVTLASV